MPSMGSGIRVAVEKRHRFGRRHLLNKAKSASVLASSMRDGPNDNLSRATKS